MRGHRRRRAVMAFDLDQAGLGAAALAQLAGADIEGEGVGIAVLFQRPIGALVGRIEPVHNRKTGTLDVLGTWWEDGVRPAALKRPLADLRRWLNAPGD